MTYSDRNKTLYTKIWKVKKPRSHTYWITWERYKMLIPENQPRLLGIGCGIRPKIPVEGSYFIDLSQPALSTLEKFGGICHCGSATTLPYDSNFFDFVSASEVLEHIEDDVKVISEVNRTLRLGGYFGITVPLHMRHWSSFDESVNHVRRYDPGELCQKFTEAGFTLDTFLPTYPTTSKIYKKLASFMLKHAPNTGTFIEEKVSLPIGNLFQSLKKNSWLQNDFQNKLQNATGVIAVFQKI